MGNRGWRIGCAKLSSGGLAPVRFGLRLLFRLVPFRLTFDSSDLYVFDGKEMSTVMAAINVQRLSIREERSSLGLLAD